MDGVSYDEELKTVFVCKIQAHIRRYLSRRKIVKELNTRYEKIYDPIRKRYYYYDIWTDSSSWYKPVLFKKEDVSKISPTYFPDEAAVIIQRALHRHVARRLVRLLYADVLKVTIDPSTRLPTYTNPKTGAVMTTLPAFMGGKLNHGYRDAAKIKKKFYNKLKGITDSKSPKKKKEETDAEEETEKEKDESDNEGEEDVADDESDGSDLSESSDAVVERRRLLRNYPRSKVQAIVDLAEDSRKTVSELNLSGIGAIKFTSRVFDLTKLTKLNMSHNKLRKISIYIKFLNHLTYLDVSHNKIKTLPMEMEELTKLKIFNASHNRIATYPGAFYKLKNLQQLDLSHNPLTVIPIEVGNLQLLKELQKWEVGIGLLGNLQTVTIDGIQLTAWPSQFETLILLQHLTISNNKVPEIPVSICDHVKLSSLDASNNEIAAIPLSLFYLPLKSINLKQNQIAALPDKADEATKPPAKLMRLYKSSLIEFDLSHNNLCELNNLMAHFVALKTLDVSYNQLATISNEFCSVTTLSSLNLSHNELTELPIDFGNCKLLTNLDISYNKLTELPNSMSQLRNLNTFKVSNNNLLEYSGKIAAMLSNLEYLDISHNAINKLPASLFTCTKLRVLNCSFNEIAVLPLSIGKLTVLSTFDISHNVLEYIPPEIGTATNLTELFLSYNSISDIPQSIAQLQKLLRITLDHNKLTESPQLLNVLPLLKGWNLSWNLIKGRAVDSHSLDKHLNLSRDCIPLQSLQKLIGQSWDRLVLLMTDAHAYRPLMITKVGATEAMLMGKDAVHAAHKRENMHNKIRQSIADVNKWEKQLQQIVMGLKHSYQLAINTANSQFNSNNSSTSNLSSRAISERVTISDDEIDSLAQAGLIALERRRCQLQYAMLISRIERSSLISFEEFQTLFLSDSEADSGQNGNDTHSNNVSSMVPDAEVIETLNLGIEYQRSIDLFEQAIREMSFVAIADWANIYFRGDRFRKPQKQLQLQQDTELEREQQRKQELQEQMDALESASNKALLEAALGESLPRIESSKSAVETVVPAKAAHVNKLKIADGNSLDNILINLSTLRGLAIEKKLIVSIYDLPRIMHYPMLSMEMSALSICSLHAYIGLAIALQMRCDRIAGAIRTVENRASIKISCLGVGQRIGDDYMDLIEDVGSALSSRVQQNTMTASILTGKTQKQAAKAQLVKQASKGVHIGEDGQVSASKLGTHGIVGVSTKVKHAAKERKPPIENDEIIDSAIELDTAHRCIRYLLTLRRHMLIWACKLLDSAAESLSMCGWDNSFMVNSQHAKIGDAVPQECQHLRSYAIDVYYTMGRVHQGLEMYSEANLNFRTARKLAPHHRQICIELIKNCLASGDYILAKNFILGMIRKELTELNIAKHEDPLFVYRQDKELGLLLMYCQVHLDAVTAAGVQSVAQQKVFHCKENGLLGRPIEILCPELKYGRKLNYKKDFDKVQDKKQAAAELQEIEESRDVLLTNVGRMFMKFRQIMNDASIELNESGYL